MGDPTAKGEADRVEDKGEKCILSVSMLLHIAVSSESQRNRRLGNSHMVTGLQRQSRRAWHSPAHKHIHQICLDVKQRNSLPNLSQLYLSRPLILVQHLIVPLHTHQTNLEIDIVRMRKIKLYETLHTASRLEIVRQLSTRVDDDRVVAHLHSEVLHRWLCSKRAGGLGRS